MSAHAEAADPLPPDPMTQAKHRMGEIAQDQAKDMAMRQVRTRLKSVLPKMLHPLIPGEKGTVGDNVIGMVRRRFWAAVGSVVASLVFFAFFAAITLMFVVVIAFALLTSM